MFWTQEPDPSPRAEGRYLSGTSTTSSSSETDSIVQDTRPGGLFIYHNLKESSALAFPIHSSSTSSSTKTDSTLLAMPAATPSGSLQVRSLSTTNWRTQYPRIGQFAMTPSEEVVAAGPEGLISFMRVQDHPSKPWSEPRLFPPTKASLDASTVTGLALYQEDKSTLHVYCVAKGKLHAFYRSEKPGSFFATDRSPPFSGTKISGPLAVAGIEADYSDHNWCVVASCRSGGLLFTSTRFSHGSDCDAPKQCWEPAKHVATHMGIISAVSIVATHTEKSYSHGFSDEENTDIVAVCIASGRLHSIEGPFERLPFYKGNNWKNPKSIKFQHPGEVTGNPVLLSNQSFEKSDCNLDLLVPSAEGGIFHFIRTPKSHAEWHMIGRISFPSGVPIASCLAAARLGGDTSARSEFRAHVQCGGRLYLIKTTEGASPWDGSQLYPIEGPGPFFY